MNPWLYLLSTICAHSCNFPTPQVILMMMIGMRTIAMSIRFGVNQSTVSLCGASVDSVVYFMLSFLYETMWYIILSYVINTAMVHLRFVYLCVRLFLGHIWVFYASYFVLKIWVWHRGCLYLRSRTPTSLANEKWTTKDHVAVTYAAYHTIRLTGDIHK